MHTKAAWKTGFILAGMLASCALLCGTRAYAGESQREITRVSVILPHDGDGYWEFIKNGILDASEELGEDSGIDIGIVYPQLNYNIVQMTDLLKQQIAAQVDVLVVQGNEDEEFLSALRQAYDQGIKIVCVDTDIRDFPDHLYIGTDNYAAGQLLGEHLVELTGGTASVAVISGEPGYLNLEERLQGLQDAVQEVPGIVLGDVAYDKYDGLTVISLYHELSDGADAVVFLEGTGGQAVASQYQVRDGEYQYILGFDAFEGVAKGALDGVVKQDTHQMGVRVVEEIADYVRSGEYGTESICTDVTWLTSENYKEILLEDEMAYLTGETDDEDVE